MNTETILILTYIVSFIIAWIDIRLEISLYNYKPALFDVVIVLMPFVNTLWVIISSALAISHSENGQKLIRKFFLK